VQRFVAAAGGGDLQTLLDLLAPDAVLLSDTGGKAKAALRPITGSDKIARLLVALRSQASDVGFRMLTVNGATAVAVSLDGGDFDSLFGVGVTDGRVSTIYLVRNPDKLSDLGAVRPVAR
jgi:RNA polymerase sigma-70 factor (ECF subfamily)